MEEVYKELESGAGFCLERGTRGFADIGQKSYSTQTGSKCKAARRDSHPSPFCEFVGSDTLPKKHSISIISDIPCWSIETSL
jgi:hypothetical protein